jgi:polysaccharide biosynthesis protein PslG
MSLKPWRDRVGLNIHAPSDAMVDRAAECGAGWVRIDFDWRAIEPVRGTRQFQEHDRIVSRARARGLKMYGTLAYTPSWASGQPDPAVPPVQPGDWTTFVTAVVGRFRGTVSHWGIWNEPNLPGYGKMTPAEYRDVLLKPGYGAVKAADPGAQVVSADLLVTSGQKWWEWMAGIYGGGGAAFTDVVSCHVYENAGPDRVLEVFEKGKRLFGESAMFCPAFLYGALPQFQPILHVRQQLGLDGKPLWLTETGWRTKFQDRPGEVTEAAQSANYLTLLRRAFAENAAPWLERVFFYELKDDPAIADRWGVLFPDGQPKQCFNDLQSELTT